jgi:hypothetical protein
MKLLYIITLSVILSVVSFGTVFADDTISVNIDKTSYTYGDAITLSLDVPQEYESSEVLIEVYDPGRRQIYSERIVASDDNTIKYDILGTLWKKTGTYRIDAEIYGGIEGTIIFEIVEKTEPEIKDTNSQIILEPISLSVTTDKKSYQYSDDIAITGTINKIIPEQFLTLQIIDSDNMLVNVDQFIPSVHLDVISQNSDGEVFTFSKQYDISGKLWGNNGVYKVKIFYLNHDAVTEFEFADNRDDKYGNNYKNNDISDKQSDVIVYDNTQLQTLTQTDREERTLREILVDSAKSPQHYIDRYYSEESYRNWFDGTYPDYTINDVKYTETFLYGFPSNDLPALHYVERYANEESYRNWFDDNFAGTMEGIVGYESIVCENRKVVIFEKRDNSPVCVSNHIGLNLQDRGWAVSFVE